MNKPLEICKLLILLSTLGLTLLVGIHAEIDYFHNLKTLYLFQYVVDLKNIPLLNILV